MKNRMRLRVLLTSIIALCSIAFGGVDAHAAGWLKDEMHFADTLKTPKKIDQFMKAVEVAPKTWVYKEAIWKSSQMVTFKRLKFNDSMAKTLESELVSNDEGLKKRMTRLHKMTKALNATVDMTIGYNKLPDGRLAVSYDISNLTFGNRKD